MKAIEELLRGDTGSRILPFLWMKGEGIDTIFDELDKIEACGIREVCLESRPHPDFCGPGWWETLDALLPEARRRGLRLWLLDDDKFPTGHANGGFERRPELKKTYLAERHMDVMGPCRNSAVLVKNFLGSEGRLLGILACPKPDSETLNVSGEGILDLTDSLRDGFVYFDLPEGAYRLFVLFTTQKGGGRDGYMNLIDSRSVRVLIDEVYEKHYERYKAYFGSTIAGFFSDEPELGNTPGYAFDAGLGRRDTRLPWSGELEERLRREWGGDFLTNLPALWYEMTGSGGRRTARARSGYMEALTDLVYTCFSGQIGAWCESRGVEYIGHVIEDDNAHARLGCSVGHYFKEMRGQSMAGVDVVHHQIVPGFTGTVHQWIAGDRDGEFFHFGLAKLASSAARLDPRKKNRALCELFGNYGWGEGVSLMKWLANHMLVRGINVFTPHAFSMAYPDRDCPPHFYARGNNPQFPAFIRLMKYMQRAGGLLASGRPVTDAAVLYHAESEWTGREAQLFQKPVRALMENGLDCDVVPADMLTPQRARVAGGRLAVGEASWPCLILPYARCEKRSVAEFAIYAAGEGLPVFAVDGAAEFDERMEPLPEAFRRSVVITPLSGLAEEVKRRIPLRVSFSPMPDSQRKNLRQMSLTGAEGQIWMFFNEGLTETVRTEAAFDGGFGAVTVYDPWSNAARSFSVPGGRMPLALAPQEALFFALEREIPGAPALPALRGRETLRLRWSVSRADELHYGDFQPLAEFGPGEELPNMNGPAMTPTFTGFYRYDASFLWEEKPGRLCRLVLPEGGDAVDVFVNGEDLGWHAGFPVGVDVTGKLRDGENSLRLEFTTTLVWKLRDGASTHLQLGGTGLLAAPVLETYM